MALPVFGYREWAIVTYGGNLWTLSDNYGRTHRVYFKADPGGYYPAIIDKIELAASNGTIATVTFSYTSGSFPCPSIDNDPATSTSVNLPLMTAINHADGSKHAFTYHPSEAPDSAGRLAGMQLPTMGKIEWTYRLYKYSTDGIPALLNMVLRQNTGVATRKLVNINGNVDGTWTFTPSLQPVGSEDCGLSNTVMTPLGDKTVHYFSVNTKSSGSEWNKSDYGLPLVKNQFDRPRNSSINVALSSSGATATASNTANSLYPASAAINGDRKGLNWGNGGVWVDGSPNFFPDWLEVNFNAQRIIDKVNVFTLQDNPDNPVEPTAEMTFTQGGIRNFDIQYWNGSAWTTIPGSSVVANEKVWRQFVFPPIATNKIRVLVNQASMSSRIAEVEAFQSSLAPETRFLSRQVFDCDGSGNNCQLMRSTYVRYEQDQTTDPTSPEVVSVNRRETSNRIVYHDDVENGIARYADIDRTNFDGLGHYRQVTFTANFGSSDLRTIFVDYDAATGTYPSTTYSMPQPSAVWLPNIFALQRITEGGSARFTEYCFDRGNGFLRRTRRWSATNPTGQRNSNDVLTLYTPDLFGQVVTEQFYGGDVQALGTQPLCSLSVPSSDQYRIQHSYSYGARSSSQYYTASASPIGPKFLDRTIDRNTGLVLASRDSAGILTNYEYDQLGRQTWIKPEAGHGAWKHFSYTLATSADYARIFIYNKANGNGAVLMHNVDVYDSFGRVWWQQAMVPGSYPNLYTLYNAMGWVTHKSALGVDAPTYTLYLNYDPFGRPRTERPLDGQHHDIVFEYKGVSTVKRTAQVGFTFNPSTGQIAEVPRSTTWIYDLQGKLRKQITHAGTGSSSLDTEVTHSYDASGHIIESRRNGGMLNSLAAYDGRGFMFYYTDQSGQSQFLSNFDALGNALRMRPSDINLSYVYDRADRLIRVQDAADASKVFKEFVYADTNGMNDWRAGRLWTTRRYNYFPNAPTAVVSETNTYGGSGGRVSKYEVELNNGQRAAEKFAQTYGYDELGNITDIGYANGTLAGSGNLNRERIVSNSYVGRYLTAVAGSLNGQAESWASSINYHPNGFEKQIVHSNGVTDHIAADPDGFVRTASVSTTGVKQFHSGVDDNFSSGDFQYDGLKTIVRIGSRYMVSSQNLQLPPETSFPQLPRPSCEQGLFDVFGLLYGTNSSNCIPQTLMFYTASDRRVVVENRIEDIRTWYFYDTEGRLATVYNRSNAIGTWLSTIDHIYRGSAKLAVAECLRDAPSSRISHFHLGYGLPGIKTDANGYKVRD